MKLVILIDNSSNPFENFLTEHGLSIYFEADNSKWLMDVGASGKFAENAKNMGIDIADIDYLVLSHAHGDHTGGLEEFARLNSKARVFLSSNIKDNSYFSTRRGSKRDISIDYSIIQNNTHRVVEVRSTNKLSSSVTILCNIPIRFDTPIANRTLLVNDKQDDFKHEIALCVATPRGDIVISACSHLGILNTLAACGERNIVAYIGGTHLIDSDKDNQYELNGQIVETAKQIRSLYPLAQVISGHCTGLNAQKIFSEILADRFTGFYSGLSLEL